MRSSFRVPAALSVAGILAITNAGCSDSTSPDARIRTEITYASTHAESATEPDRASVSTAGKQIRIEGAFTAADPCRELAAAVEVDGTVVRVTVRAELPDNPQGCIAVLERFTYDASVIGLASGTWTVEVLHREFGLGTPHVVASDAVVLP
jgi:hypothetical protein